MWPEYGLRAQNYLLPFFIITWVFDLLVDFRISYNNTLDYIFILVFSIRIIFFSFLFYANIRTGFRWLPFAVGVLFFVYFTIHLFTEGMHYTHHIRIAIAVSYVIVALGWFVNYVIQENNKITDNPFFYISVGLLVWGVFFLFRMRGKHLNSINDDFFRLALTFGDYIITTFQFAMLAISLYKMESGIKNNTNEPVAR